MRAVVFLVAALSFGQTAQQRPASPSNTKKQKTATAEPLWQKMLRVSGVSATPSAQRGGEDEPKSGRVWATNLDDLRSRPVTLEGGFYWPVCDPRGGTFLALKQDKLVRVSLEGGKQKELFIVDRVRKLVGFDRDEPDEVIALVTAEGQRLSPATISLTSGHVSEIPFDPGSAEDLALLKFLRGSERAYGSKHVFVASTTTEDVGGTREWTDVYLRDSGAQAINISHCDKVNCGQPSLSADGRTVVFIKAGR
jgi:hypothetical protein